MVRYRDQTGLKKKKKPCVFVIQTAKQTEGEREREYDEEARGVNGGTRACSSPGSQQTGTEVWQPHKVNILLWHTCAL